MLGINTYGNAKLMFDDWKEMNKKIETIENGKYLLIDCQLITSVFGSKYKTKWIA